MLYIYSHLLPLFGRMLQHPSFTFELTLNMVPSICGLNCTCDLGLMELLCPAENIFKVINVDIMADLVR